MSKKSALWKVTAFWKIVFQESWKTAMEASGIKGLSIAVILAFVIFGILFLLSSLRVLPENCDILIGDFSAEIRTQLLYLILSLIFLILIFVFSLVYIPAKIYEKQGGFVDNPFEIVARPPLPKKNDEFRYASLSIKNNSASVIQDCFVTLDDVIDKKSKSVLFSRQRRLSWSSGEGLDGNLVNKEINVVPNEPRVCDIATTAPNNSEVTLTVWRGTQSFRTGKYRVKVSAHGQWNGISVFKTEYFTLEYKGNNRLTIT